MSAPPRKDSDQIATDVLKILYEWVQEQGVASKVQDVRIIDLRVLAQRVAAYAEPLQENR